MEKCSLDFTTTKSVDGRQTGKWQMYVCIESLAPSSVDYKFVRQFVGEGDRRRARAASPAAAAPLSRELTGWMSGGGAAKGLHYRLPQLNCSIFMERGEGSFLALSPLDSGR